MQREGAPNKEPVQYVIVGCGPAGLSAAAEIAEHDPEGEITLITHEPHPPYSRPLITHLISGEITLEEIEEGLSAWWSGRGWPLKHAKITSLDVSSKRFITEAGEEIPYDCALIATGARPAVGALAAALGLPEALPNGVFTFHNLDQACAVSDFLSSRDHTAITGAVIIGGGLIGLKAAEALKIAGLQTTVVELEGHLLPRMLDARGASIIEAIYREEDVEILTGTSVERISLSPSGDVQAVRLSGGRTIEASLVILATGVKPNTNILRGPVGKGGHTVEAGEGIRVNRFLETSAPRLFAAGDVAEVEDFLAGGTAVYANWTNAREEGRIAGRNMVSRCRDGTMEPFHYGMARNAVTFFDHPCATLGLSTGAEPGKGESTRWEATEAPTAPAGKYETIERYNPARKVYARLVFRDEVLVGAIFIGETHLAGEVHYLLSERVTVGDIKDEILREGLPYIERLRSLHRQEIEGDMEWEPRVALEKEYHKRFDVEKWQKREKAT
jgi:NADPH-dependent 2,4-dienoyl-CoA reductase/sulfur reductase-like enzyme